MNLKARAKNLKTAIPALFLSLKDKDTPLPAKIAAGITVGYASGFHTHPGLSGRPNPTPRPYYHNHQTHPKRHMGKEQKTSAEHQYTYSRQKMVLRASHNPNLASHNPHTHQIPNPITLLQKAPPAPKQGVSRAGVRVRAGFPRLSAPAVGKAREGIGRSY